MSPDQKGIETPKRRRRNAKKLFTMSPDQKGIETIPEPNKRPGKDVHNEPRSKGD